MLGGVSLSWEEGVADENIDGVDRMPERSSEDE